MKFSAILLAAALVAPVAAHAQSSDLTEAYSICVARQKFMQGERVFAPGFEHCSEVFLEWSKAMQANNDAKAAAEAARTKSLLDKIRGQK